MTLKISMVMLAVVMAADAMTELPGGASWAGWASFLTSGGVLVWLLFWHLPAKDKQLKEIMDGKDKMISDLTERYEDKLEKVSDAFKEDSTESRKEFKGALDLVLKHCENETQGLASVFRAELTRLVSDFKRT